MRILMRAFVALVASIGICRAEDPESFHYFEYPSAKPDKVFKGKKAFNEATGRIEVKLYENGQSVNEALTSLEQQEWSLKKSMRGALSERMHARIGGMTLFQKAKVSIHLKFPPITYPDKTQNTESVLIASSIASTQIQPVISLSTLSLRHQLLGMEARGSATLTGEVTRLQLEALKLDSDVSEVEEWNEEEQLSVELPTLAPSAYNPGSVPSGSGSGVRAATSETGLTSGFLSCIGVTPSSWDANNNYQPDNIRHANASFRVLVASSPSATFYHRRSDSFEGTVDQNFIINNAIQTISMSLTKGGTSPYRSTNAEFLIMDDMAYRYPYPVYVNPAANAGYSYEVNWQCYNAISVGNVRHTNNSTYEMADCTQTKNPPPVYGSCISGSGSNCAGDREMPYLVASGFPNTDSEFGTTCLEGSGGVGCGTSWSAPAVNGMAANVIAADSRIVSWPEKVRATLILTAQNVDGGYWASGTDGRDGSGVVSGSEAVSFAQNHTTVWTGNSAVEKGMGANSLYAGDFGGSYKRYNYVVPNPKPSGKHLRAVLTWDCNPIVGGGGTSNLSDLDLIVQKNGSTQGSYSWDGNVEVVDVAAADLTAGSSYYIDVAPVINRIPSSGSRTNYIYFAVAWAWVKDHAD